jgi:hypothetical protein
MNIKSTMKKYGRRLVAKSKHSQITPHNIKFHIDELTVDKFAGWIYLQDDEQFLCCSLTLLINGKKCLHVRANQYRSDLLESGFGSGCHGFNVAVSWQDFELNKNSIEVKVGAISVYQAEIFVEQKQMLVAMTKQLTKHFDEALGAITAKMSDLSTSSSLKV